MVHVRRVCLRRGHANHVCALGPPELRPSHPASFLLFPEDFSFHKFFLLFILFFFNFQQDSDDVHLSVTRGRKLFLCRKLAVCTYWKLVHESVREQKPEDDIIFVLNVKQFLIIDISINFVPSLIEEFQQCLSALLKVEWEGCIDYWMIIDRYKTKVLKRPTKVHAELKSSVFDIVIRDLEELMKRTNGMHTERGSPHGVCCYKYIN